MRTEEDDNDDGETFGDWDTTTVCTTMDVLLLDVREPGALKLVVIVEPEDPPASVGETVGVAVPPPLLLLLLGAAAVLPGGEPAGDDVGDVGEEVLVDEVAN